MDRRFVVVSGVCESVAGYFFAFAPDECRIYSGDKVDLDNGVKGLVIVKEDYETMEDVKDREKLLGRPLPMVIRSYRRQGDVDWQGVDYGREASIQEP